MWKLNIIQYAKEEIIMEWCQQDHWLGVCSLRTLTKMNLTLRDVHIKIKKLQQPSGAQKPRMAALKNK